MSQTLPHGRRPINRRKLREALEGYFFISPVVLGIVIFTLYPIAMSFYYGFTRYDLLSSPRWVGLRNYEWLLTNEKFLTALTVTIRYALISVPLGLIISGLLALLLNRVSRGAGIYTALFYIPVMVPLVATAILFSDLYNVKYGLINSALKAIGLKPYTWTSRPETALNALIIMSLWTVGASTIIWLAGLRAVPGSLYEAAEIDGANTLRRFWHITIPMVTPVIFFNLVMGIIAALQVFTQSFVMTSGGPDNSTLFLVLYVYNVAFTEFRMGRAAVLAWVLFFMIAILTFVVFKTSGWVYYEGEEG